MEANFKSHHLFKAEHGEHYRTYYYDHMLEMCGILEHPTIKELKKLRNGTHTVLIMLKNNEVMKVGSTINALFYYWDIIRPSKPTLLMDIPDVVVVQTAMAKKDSFALRDAVKENTKPYIRKKKILNFLADE